MTSSLGKQIINHQEFEHNSAQFCYLHGTYDKKNPLPVQLLFEPCPLTRSPLVQPPTVECKSLRPSRPDVIPEDYPKIVKLILISVLYRDPLFMIRQS